MFLSKKTLQRALQELALLDGGSQKQGLTQKVSTIRHFFALDAYCKKTNSNSLDCSSAAGSKQGKDEFISEVKNVVGLDGSHYTTNFIATKTESDCNVGSNFFSAGAVKISANSSVPVDYPSRGGMLPVIQASSCIIKPHPQAYSNLCSYFPTGGLKAAIFLWLARGNSNFSGSRSNVYSDLQTAVSLRYSSNLIASVFPTQQDVDQLIAAIPDSDLFDQNQAILSTSDFSSPSIPMPTTTTTPPTSIPLKRQRIVFGAPGTGKSWKLNNEAHTYFADADIERVTFFRNYSYGAFVGSYKPVMVNHDIEYAYQPGPFMRTLTNALS